jgi:phage shock protein PspC (stress-responsive transcriptional regulator)
MSNRYLLDKNSAKLTGVCAGLTNMFKINALSFVSSRCFLRSCSGR